MMQSIIYLVVRLKMSNFAELNRMMLNYGTYYHSVGYC